MSCLWPFMFYETIHSITIYRLWWSFCSPASVEKRWRFLWSISLSKHSIMREYHFSGKYKSKWRKRKCLDVRKQIARRPCLFALKKLGKNKHFESLKTTQFLEKTLFLLSTERSTLILNEPYNDWNGLTFIFYLVQICTKKFGT